MKLILLPGLDGTGLLFQPLLEALPSELDVIVISYPHDVLMSYEELIEYVAARLPEEDYILIAESFAGPIAYQLVQRKPSHLKSVIFVATFLDSPRPLLGRLSGLFSPSLIRFMPDLMLKTFLLGSAANKGMLKLFKESVNKVSPKVLSFRLGELSKRSKLDHHQDQKQNVSAIYIQASNDKLVLKKSVKDFKKVFSGLEVFEVKGSHFILQTNPQACSQIINNHLLSIANA